MSSLNKAMIIGNLTKDPEVRQAGNTNVANLDVATNERYKDSNGEWQDKAEYHKVVIWGNLADVCQKYLSKGSKVYLEGSLQTESWEKDGVKRYTTKIKAFKMTMLDSKGQSKQEVPNNFDDMDDDLPFIWLLLLMPSLGMLSQNLPF